MDAVNINQSWFHCSCACTLLEHALRSFCFRSEIKKKKSFEQCSLPRPIKSFLLETPKMYEQGLFVSFRMLDDFGHEIENTESRMDNVMKKMAKVLHMSNGNLSFLAYL